MKSSAVLWTGIGYLISGTLFTPALMPGATTQAQFNTEFRTIELDVKHKMYDIVPNNVTADLDDSGNLHIAYVEDVDEVDVIRYVQLRKGSLTTPEEVYRGSRASAWLVAPSIVTDYDGFPHLTWIEKRDGDKGNRAGNYAIMYATRTAAGAWTSEQVSTNPDDPDAIDHNPLNTRNNNRPDISVAPDGSIVIIYGSISHITGQGYGLAYARKFGNEWERKVAFYPEAQYTINSQRSISLPRKMPVTDYMTYIDISEYSPRYIYRDGEQWTEKIVGDYESVFSNNHPTIETDNNGGVHMMWFNTENEHKFIHARINDGDVSSISEHPTDFNRGGNLTPSAIDPVTGDVYFFYARAFSPNRYLLYFDEEGEKQELLITDIGGLHGRRSLSVRDGVVYIITARSSDEKIWITTNDTPDTGTEPEEYDISVVTDSDVAFPRQTVNFDIVAGSEENPVADLFGAGFQLTYNADHFTFVDAVPGPFLNTDDDLLFFTEVDEDNGLIAVAVSRMESSGGVDGFGSIAQLTLQVKEDISEVTEIFGLQEVMAVNPSGVEIPLSKHHATIGLIPFVVWPGDTNNDGVVDATDLLPIGQFFGMEGPAREDRTLTWDMKQATPWDEIAATWADATGDGKINQNDVLPIGLNYGLTHGGQEKKLEKPPLASDTTPTHTITIPQSGPGQTFTITLALGSESNPIDEILGVSARVAIPDEIIEVLQVDKGTLFGEADLLSFMHYDDEISVKSAAFTRKRSDGPVSGFGEALVIELTSPEGFDQPVEISLLESAVSDLSTIHYNPPVEIILSEVLSADDLQQTVPTEFSLEQNYPNPFNPVTTIRYALPESAPVALAVYNLLGQQVAVLVNETQSAGRYEVSFDASALPSGVYVYQLQSGNYIETRKLMLVK